jgi:glycerol uptake facilitator-like aquaporin
MLGTSFLLAAVVGSGIMGERLAGGNAAIALLANTIATGAALVGLILALGPISGAHFNPVVTLGLVMKRTMPWKDAAVYILAQILGGLLGVAAANRMFGCHVFFISSHVRSGSSQLFSEFVATFGLITLIWACSKSRPSAVPFVVGAYITAAYWFTASTSFANPAVTLARAFSDTYAGIRPGDVPGFVAAQLVGGTAATIFCNWLLQPQSTSCAQRIED